MFMVALVCGSPKHCNCAKILVRLMSIEKQTGSKANLPSSECWARMNSSLPET